MAGVLGRRSLPISLNPVRAVVPGFAPTIYAQTPTLQYHINTATITTLGGNVTFTGSISGTNLVVTAISAGTFTIGMLVFGGAAPGAQLGRRITALGGGGGGATGTFTLSDSPSSTVTSSSMTATGAYTVLAVSEKNGGAALTALAATAPILITEMPDGSMQMGAVPGGRAMLRFANIANQTTASTAKITTTGLDSHNITLLAAMRSHGTPVATIANLTSTTGHRILGIGPASFVSANTVGQPFVANEAGSVGESVLPANLNALFVGATLSVVGSSTATVDGVGGVSASMPAILYNNDQSQSVTANITRLTAQTDIILAQNNSGGARAAMDLAELSIWSAGEMASANYASRSLAAMTVMRSNYGAVPFTRRICVFGDSRSQESYSGGDQLGLMLARQASAGTQVVAYVISGGTMSQLWQSMADAISLFNSASRISATDRVIIYIGNNELNTDAPVWPSLNTTASTDARAQEAYNGTLLDFSGTATVSGTTLTIQSVTSGKLLNGQPLNIAGVTPGALIGSGALLNVGNNTVGGTISISGGRNYTVSTATALTAQWPNLVRVVSTLLSRGFQVGIGTNTGSTSTFNTIFNNHIMNDLTNDVLAGAGQTYVGKLKVVDLTAITVSGSFIFGANLGATVATYFRDSGVHPNDSGRIVLYNGGDTPANGWKTLMQ